MRGQVVDGVPTLDHQICDTDCSRQRNAGGRAGVSRSRSTRWRGPVVAGVLLAIAGLTSFVPAASIGPEDRVPLSTRPAGRAEALLPARVDFGPALVVRRTRTEPGNRRLTWFTMLPRTRPAVTATATVVGASEPVTQAWRRSYGHASRRGPPAATPLQLISPRAASAHAGALLPFGRPVRPSRPRSRSAEDQSGRYGLGARLRRRSSCS